MLCRINEFYEYVNNVIGFVQILFLEIVFVHYDYFELEFN